jgi:hypothetical protein
VALDRHADTGELLINMRVPAISSCAFLPDIFVHSSLEKPLRRRTNASTRTTQATIAGLGKVAA